MMAVSMLFAPPPSGSRMTDRQYRPLIERLTSPIARTLLRQRLRRQAWLLERVGDPVARDLALAVAAQLAEASPAELARQPFLRALVDRGVATVLADVFDPF